MILFNLLKMKQEKNIGKIRKILMVLPEELVDFLNECPIQYKLVSYIQPHDKYDVNTYNGMIRQKETHFDVEILNTIENDYLFKEVVLHEIGHILDIFLANKFFLFDNENNLAQTNFVSDSIEMNVNYRNINRILNILLDEEDYGYYLNNPREMFAELFALYYSGHYKKVFESHDYSSVIEFFNKIERMAKEVVEDLND